MRNNQALANKQHDRQSLKDLQDAMLSCGSHIDLPVSHRFINGVYAREIFIPCGVLVAGRIHKTEHISIISQGCVEVVTDNVITGEVLREIYQAPCSFISPVGTKRMVQAVEDTVWTTIHKHDGQHSPENIEDIYTWPDYQAYEDEAIGFVVSNQIEESAL